MIASSSIVQGIENHVESLEEVNSVVGIENTVVVGLNFDIWVELESRFTRNHRLGLSDVLFVKQELAIQIRDIDCVQINLEE